MLNKCIDPTAKSTYNNTNVIDMPLAIYETESYKNIMFNLFLGQVIRLIKLLCRVFHKL